MHANKERKALIMRIFIITCALIFLYVPIVTLITYSFNESRMVTVWTEFSLKWYYALFNNAAIIKAVGISLVIAFFTALASVVIGTLAAFVLVRVGRFRGESLFVLLITAPMVLPEVITGLALLLIFVTLGTEIPIFAHRGIFAIWIAHVTFCSAYTTVVIRSRFRELDISIEEAAMDLGAGPIKVFFAIILPALMPAEVAAFLLSFTMSMDDLVITSFIAGPDSTTLPMLIFSSVRRGLSPEINALATIIVFIVSIFTFFAWLSMVKKQKRMKADAAKAAKATALEEKHYSAQAPHGDTPHALAQNKMSEEQMALLKEQVAALHEGRDIAYEIAEKWQALQQGTIKQNAPYAHQEVLAKTLDSQKPQQAPNATLQSLSREANSEQNQTQSSLKDIANLNNSAQAKAQAKAQAQALDNVSNQVQQNSNEEQQNYSSLVEEFTVQVAHVDEKTLAQAENEALHVAGNANQDNEPLNSEAVVKTKDALDFKKAHQEENSKDLALSSQSSDAPYTTLDSLEDSKEHKSHNHEQLEKLGSLAQEANENPDLLATSKKNLQNAKEKEQEKNQKVSVLGESAKEATETQRKLSSSKAVAGMAKVVDVVENTSEEHENIAQKVAKIAENLDRQIDEEPLKEQGQAKATNTGNIAKESASTSTKPSSKLKQSLFGANSTDKATTSSSLENAKAKKAALKTALAPVVEQAVVDQGDSISSQAKKPTTTTSTLTETKKSKSAQNSKEDSASKVKISKDKINTASDKVKVVDITQNSSS